MAARIITTTAICPQGGECIASCQIRCVRVRVPPIALMEADYRPALHFVGFRGEEYHSAVSIWGLPDFYHRVWDQRAQREIADIDLVVFAKYDPGNPSPFNFDDSNEPDDPANKERLR